MQDIYNDVLNATDALDPEYLKYVRKILSKHKTAQEEQINQMSVSQAVALQEMRQRKNKIEQHKNMNGTYDGLSVADKQFIQWFETQ